MDRLDNTPMPCDWGWVRLGQHGSGICFGLFFFFFENMDCKGERAVALFCTDIAARGPGLSSSPFALALPILHLHLYLDQPGLLLRL